MVRIELNVVECTRTGDGLLGRQARSADPGVQEGYGAVHRGGLGLRFGLELG